MNRAQFPIECPQTRQSLVNRLTDADDWAGWQRFFDTYRNLIYRTAIRAGLSDFEAQEVLQETLINLARSIPKFHYDPEHGSFKGWLMKITWWRIKDQFRKREVAAKHIVPGLDTGRYTSKADRIPDPAAEGPVPAMERQWREDLFQLALAQIRRSVDPHHYQIFYLYAIKNEPVEKVCSLLHVLPRQVYLVKHRILSQLKHQVSVLERQQNQ